MTRSGPLLTEAQWKKIAPLLPKPPSSVPSRKRPFTARAMASSESSRSLKGTPVLGGFG